MEILLDFPEINVGQFLKKVEVASTGGEAKILVANGRVKINGRVVTSRGTKLKDGDTVTVGHQEFRVKYRLESEDI